MRKIIITKPDSTIHHRGNMKIQQKGSCTYFDIHAWGTNNDEVTVLNKIFSLIKHKLAKNGFNTIVPAISTHNTKHHNKEIGDELK